MIGGRRTGGRGGDALARRLGAVARSGAHPAPRPGIGEAAGGIWGELYDALGTSASSEFQINCSQNDADYPQVGTPTTSYISGYGYLMVVWVSHDSGGDTLRAQDFFGTGTLSGSSWIVGTSDPTVLALASLADEAGWSTSYECSF